MNLAKLVSDAKKLVSDNSHVILTAIGVTGTITTAVLAAKASFKASKVIEETQPEYIKGEMRHLLDTKQKTKLVWKLYIPAVVTGGLTCTCIVGANYIGTKRAAALAAAYSLSETAMNEYKSKVVDRIGESEEQRLRDELDRERGKVNREVFLVGDSETLFLDAYSGRYFHSSKESIRRAVNDANYQILRSDYATLSDFWDSVGLDRTSISDEFGWNGDNPLEVSFSTHETPDGKACMAYDFLVVPVRNPWRI